MGNKLIIFLIYFFNFFAENLWSSNPIIKILILYLEICLKLLNNNSTKKLHNIILVYKNDLKLIQLLKKMSTTIFSKAVKRGFVMYI